MRALIRDLRFGLRLLIRQPGFTFIAVFTLTLAIGGTTAIFSAVNAILLRPLPYPRAEQLTLLAENNLQRGWQQFGVAPINFVEWQRDAQAFSALTAFQSGTAVVRRQTQAEQVRSVAASAEYFDVIARRAALGRVFQAGDDEPGRPPVAVISHAFWQRRLGGDRAVVGSALTVDDRSVTVVGVMPADIDDQASPEIWLPLPIDRTGTAASTGRTLEVLGRLKEDVTIEQASARLNVVAARLAQERPQINAGWGVTMTPLHDAVVGGVRPQLFMLFAAVLLVLLIACANIGNLLIARAIARKREIAIRLAIGATRPQIVRQLLVESILLAGIGGALGVLAAVWVLEGLKAYAVSSLPRVAEISIDLRVLAFTFVSSSVAGLAFGLAPALHATRKGAQSALRGASPHGAAPVSSWGRKSLVVAETAAAVLLLIGAGLFIRSFVRLTSVDPGFVPAHAVVFSAELPRARQGNDALVHTYFETALDGLRQTPGVVAAGATHVLPFSGNNSVRPFIREDQPAMRAEDAPATAYRLITPGYFKAMGIPLRGREFTAADTATSDGVAIINESFVRQFFRDGDPIGKRIRQAGTNPQIRWLTIVGVAGDVRHDGYASEPAPEMYWAHAQATWGETLRQIRRRMSVVVRTDGTATDSTGRVRAAMARIDPGQPVADLRPLTRFVEGTVNTRRLITVLLILFACVALALALAGTYGIVSYLTLQRSREWAIRLALGAAPQQIRGSVLRLGLGLGAAGAVIGLAGALAAGRLVEDLLFGVRHTDVMTLSIAPVLMLVTAFIACLAPARRAATADPARSLKAE